MVKKKKIEQEGELEEKKIPQKEYVFAVGRRREAVARVRIYTQPNGAFEKGKIVVNGKTVEEYFPGKVAQALYTEPFRATNTLNKFGVSVKVEGGGKKGQLGAMIHGISRALEQFDREKLRPILKKKGFLTRDPRAKERRKVGTGGKARRKKQSPKR